jgi:leucyl-tRNA synthetase
MGWDAFGLPTERQASKEGIQPAVITKRNTDTFRQQLKRLGLSYDWEREICTSDPNYYRWTQWIFLKLYERGLAYQAEVPVNWCPALGTVLANEEVKDGVYVETGDPVERRLMRQWMLRSTAYADRLLEDLNLVDWPESLKEMQRNWIGRSNGARIRFQVADNSFSFDLRDWLFSRQRYWGEPIPILRLEDETITPVPEADLPVVLPHLDEITPTPDGEPPLARAKDWLHTTDLNSGKPALRETNVMPQWAGSCWYYLRFIDPSNARKPWSKEAEQRWMPVDLYVGGAEHATLHLLYARFWHKVLYDLGYVSTPEPFQKLFNQGMILSRSFRDARGKYYYPYEVVEKDGQWVTRDTAELLETKIEKMSKSKCNVVTPDEVIDEYGADSLRLYELFLGPLKEEAIWQTEQISGVRRFLERTWRLFFYEEQQALAVTNDVENEEALAVLLHKTIKKVTEDSESLQFNTAISQLMTFVNEATKYPRISRSVLSTLARLLAPFAPHIAEEFWQHLGNQDTVAYAPWPEYDPAKIVDEQVRIAVQVNGKLRGVIDVLRGSMEENVQEIALEDPRIASYLEEQSIARVIFVTDKLINFVIR